MDLAGWLGAPDHWLVRLVFQKALALVYLDAFVVALVQFPALLGERGLLPVPRFVEAVPFRSSPSLFHWRYSDRLLRAVAWTGIALSACVVVGIADAVPAPAAMLGWAVLWILYLSIVNVGQTWYSFGWETLLCEVGFLAIFLGNAQLMPAWPLFVLLLWVLFRVEFGAGLIKMRGDACWRELTCLYYHHETQPMPNPLSWWFHRLPKPLHRLEVLGNHVAQLAVPVFLFFPQPIASFAALAVVITQGWLVLSGNFAWLNWLTLALAIPAFDDASLQRIIPIGAPTGLELPLWYAVVVVLVSLLVVVRSYGPARNLLSPRQRMNYSFDPLHLVNTYGAFGSVTKERYEVSIEGTDEAVLTPTTDWREYEFKGKPGDVMRRPPQFAPYHLRLDWLMWFAAMSSPMYHEWFMPLLEHLLEADPHVLALLRGDPFAGRRPRFLRARLWLYQFTTARERRETGAWWHRTEAGEYVRPVALRV
ncbi:MAG: lipase maturation factor family protein [Chloroflexi bacterium]|nr:lipase maturation factor family protein [Chloroflexota bacterium]